jgi:hypothetical protein
VIYVLLFGLGLIQRLEPWILFPPRAGNGCHLILFNTRCFSRVLKVGPDVATITGVLLQS